MTDASTDIPFACLPDGQGGHLSFAPPERRLVVRNEDDLADLRRRLNEPEAGWRVLFVGFEGAVALAGFGPLPDESPTPAAILWDCPAPQRSSDGPPPPPPCEWGPPPPRSAYLRAFRRVRDAIGAGEVYQLNLTFRLRGELRDVGRLPVTGSPLWSSCFSDPELSIWSRSPECFLAGNALQGRLATRPIKGTTSAPGGEALRADPKEHAEHIMIVDMARHDLGAVARTGSVLVERLLDVLDVGYARHLESTVTATPRAGTTIGAILAATLPAASISGTPKRAACRLITQVEDSPRGPYTGTLGWISPSGDLAFAVLIRTVWTTDGRNFGYGTGGGIVADSDGDREYDEALLKTAALGRPAGPS